MKKHTLSAQIRDIIGRKVKSLRAKGEVPATVYGKDVKSVSVSVRKDAFTSVYNEAGETGLIELSIAGDVRPILIHTVQKDPISGDILHAEFYQVNLKQKVKTNVPIEFTGDAPAVTQKTGVLLTLIDEVEVEALPTDLPEKILVDVSKLAEVDQEVKVADITVTPGVTILTAPDQSVIRVGSLISKEAEVQAAAEAAAAAAAAAESAAATPSAEAAAVPPAGEIPAEAVKTPEAAKTPADK